ncbi:putative quinol monooxygenase [Actinoplanes aureus]|uniref:Antibiotic biosynthesis monooxygenase n=1 Tax=Actinoplanes aureus TaxID=2792083 RepID=A0A931FYL4_9ACTN|nr:putative quinol monooxygenase [Actinoplanes aureus]MBG0563877.1 antibiotic biosynthesis monooxygenase [Actinoplanes aureus]
MPENLTVIAQLSAKPGQETALREALTALVPPTLLEPGCIAYDLHRVVDDHGSFHFYEVWRSPEEHAANLKTPHLQSFLARSGDLLDGDIQVTLLRRLASGS